MLRRHHRCRSQLVRDRRSQQQKQERGCFPRVEFSKVGASNYVERQGLKERKEDEEYYEMPAARITVQKADLPVVGDVTRQFLKLVWVTRRIEGHNLLIKHKVNPRTEEFFSKICQERATLFDQDDDLSHSPSLKNQNNKSIIND